MSLSLIFLLLCMHYGNTITKLYIKYKPFHAILCVLKHTELTYRKNTMYLDYTKKHYINTLVQRPKRQKCGNKNPVEENIGVLLINLGTPDGTDIASLRRYLREFLSDYRVIEINKIKWQFILNAFILPSRPKKIQQAYKSIWNHHLNEGPLMTITRSQAEKLQTALNGCVHNVVVDYAMRYGNPSINSKLKSLLQRGCRHILIMPLYPHYSSPTTATVVDKVADSLKNMRRQPILRTLPPYMDEPIYIQALANSVTQHLKNLPYTPEHIIATYHGVPKRYITNGDPYRCHCKKTTKLLQAQLNLNIPFTTTFQSIFGKEEWVKPYTNVTLRKMAKDGVKNITTIAPAFSADCLETLEEIQQELCEDFISSGGQNFSYIPCLNDSNDGIHLLHHLTLRELQGWITPVI